MKPISATRLVSTVIAMLLLGVATGVVWEALAKPAEWEVRADGSIVLTEIAARDQFGVIVVFVIAGIIVSLVWGIVTTLVLEDLGWKLTPLVVMVTLVAAVIAWRVGIALGPVGPREAVNPSVGDHLPSRLKVDGIAPFVAWPVFGVLGVLLTTWMRKGDDEYAGVHQGV
ncbi:hypothetical protein [Aeromicrobium panaciterrae]|uniref:hypothetical protein n=1 Tax=Aeromicrobium panaciterrae TaxID=363861 RepID=UPI0031E2833B